MNKQYCPYCMNRVEEGEVCQSCGLTEGNYEPSQNHLPPGTMLENRYLVGRVLGEGGFGITYIGCDTKLEMKVAIKEYYPAEKVQRISAVSLDLSVPSTQAKAFFDAGKRRFLQEALIMAQMDKQPEIVGVRDFFECNNTAYIVMEFVEGTTFKQLVEQRGSGIPAAELLPLVKPLFGALSNFHDKGLIHRDISPDNLMLERGAVRLLDFGCARQPERGDATMTIVLKHGYAPIEQYTNRGQGPWTDVYALGATLYFCLVGKRPPQAMDRAVDDELILPRKLGVDVTEAQEKALIRAMGVKRTQRFASMEEFCAALYPARAGQTPATIQVQLNIRNVLKNSEDRGGFSYELVDADGKVVKTASTDFHGQTRFVLTFGPETAGFTYTYTIRQMDPLRHDVVCGGEVYCLTIQIREQDGQLSARMLMDGIPADEGQLFLFHNTLRKAEIKKPAEKKKPKEKKNRPAWLETVLVLGAALAVIAAIILPVMLRDQPAEDALPPTQEEQLEVLESSLDVETVFADARVFDDGDGWLLGEFLRTNRSQAVALTDGAYYFDPSAVQTISAPLLIEAGAVMGLDDPVVLEAPLVVRGELQIRSTLMLVGDGELIMEEGSTVVGNGLVLLEDLNKGVVGRRSPSMENGVRYVSLSHEPAMGEAVHVRTEQELRTASHSGVLVVDGDITLTEGLDVNGTLIIARGASLTGSLDEESWLYLAQRSKLLNYGTVSCCLSADSGEISTSQNFIYNEGELNGRFYITGNTYLVNRGTMQWQGVQLFANSRLYNEGRMEMPEGQWGAVSDNALLRNNGTMTIRGYLDAAGTLNNLGELTVTQTGSLHNTGYLLDQGTFHLETGSGLSNFALIELAGTMIRDNDAWIDNSGVFQLNDAGAEQLQAERALPGKAVHMADRRDSGNVREVDSGEAFVAALKDDTVEAILVTNQVDITGDLTIGKPVCISSGAALVSDSQLNIQAAVHNDGSLRARTIQVSGNGQITNENTMEATEELRSAEGGILNYGTIQLHQGTLTLDNTAVMNCGAILDIGALNILNGSVLAQNGEMPVENAQVLLKNSKLVEMGSCNRYDSAAVRLEGESCFEICTPLSWNNLQIYVDQAGTLNTWMTTLDVDAQTSIENHGWIGLNGFTDYVCRFSGRMENYGTVQANYFLELPGTFENHGVLQSRQFNGEEMLVINGGQFHGNEPTEIQ